jgi:hypothetical protein
MPHSYDQYKNIQFVSLGVDCLPWHMVNRWGFRPLVSDERQQLPMNLAIQTAQSCEAMFADDFAAFCDADQYTTIRSPYGFEVGFHRGYRFAFNHEVGKYWLANGCENLVKRYQQRVANFHSFGLAGPRIYVLRLRWKINLTEVERRLADFSVDDDYRLLVLDVRRTGDELRPERRSTIVRRIELPDDNHVWYDDFDTEQGVRFELAIHDAIVDCVHQLNDKGVISR